MPQLSWPRLLFLAIGLFLLTTRFFCFAQAPVEPSALTIEPDHVVVGLFYQGQRIHVQAVAPAGSDVVALLRGQNEPLELEKKGKVGGVLWMNVSEITYHNVPCLYCIRSSCRLNRIGPAPVLNQLGFGYEALRAQVSGSPQDEAKSQFGELVKLKERDLLFSMDQQGVQLRPLEGLSNQGKQEASTDFLIPAKAPVGDYLLEVFSFQNGENRLLGSGTIHLEHSPVVASVSSLAVNHGLLYGCLAVIIAVAAGLLTGCFFGACRRGAAKRGKGM